MNLSRFLLLLCAVVTASAQTEHAIVVRAARMVDVAAIRAGKVLVEGDRIVEVGLTVRHPPGVEMIDLGDRALLPGLIDAHAHLFLHPGANHAGTSPQGVRDRKLFDLKTQEFRKQIAAGVQFAMGSDVGPFPHGTQARVCADGPVWANAASGAESRHRERG